MTLDMSPADIPLRSDAGGVIRIGPTRVTLESLVHAYLEEESAEGIVECFPTLDLADVHAVIAWFLCHRGEVEIYLQECHRKEEAGRAEAERRAPTAGLRARLLARLPR